MNVSIIILFTIFDNTVLKFLGALRRASERVLNFFDKFDKTVLNMEIFPVKQGRECRIFSTKIWKISKFVL